MDLDILYHDAIKWCKQFDSEFASILEANDDYTRSALDIERTGDKASKRIASWRDLRPQLWWFYDELFVNHQVFPYPKVFINTEVVDILDRFIASYDESDDKDTWFLKCQKVAEELQYAPTIKLYKKNPNVYKAHIGDVTMVIRVAISGLERTPDLYQMLKVMGRDRVKSRVLGAIEKIRSEFSQEQR
jgi:glutamyl-tRNA synthetase